MLEFSFLMPSDPDEQDKLVEIYQQHLQFMLRVAMKFTENLPDAEDIVQETFLRLMKNLQKVGEVDSQETCSFLATIVKNLCLTLLRKRKRMPGFDYGPSGETYEREAEETADTAPLPSEQAEYAEFQEMLRDLIHRLPSGQQELLKLYYLDEKQVREIAELMGITENAVYKRMETAKRALRKMLEEDEYDRWN